MVCSKVYFSMRVLVRSFRMKNTHRMHCLCLVVFRVEFIFVEYYAAGERTLHGEFAEVE